MFQCNFPGCDKKLSKSLIEHHHIKPREIDKSRYNRNIIPLCPLHHKLIYIPESTAGQHSINTPESIQILNKYKSTKGNTVHYQDFNGKKYFYFVESKEIIED
jgi:hypothetical protein